VSEPGKDASPLGDALLDSEFLSELESLAEAADRLDLPPAAEEVFAELGAFLAPGPGSSEPLSEDDFVRLPAAQVTERTDALLELSRRSGQREAAEAVDSFVVFFQALLPSLNTEGAEQARRLFFRIVPTLFQLCHGGFAGPSGDGVHALAQLETILIEVSSVKLSPTESSLVARSIDQLASFIAAGEYGLASDLVSTQLLAILEKNRVARMLYRLMHIEASVQVYLKERIGHLTPQIRVPEDFAGLRFYGPVRVLEENEGGRLRRLIQIQLPDVPTPRHVLLHLVPRGGGEPLDLRLDPLGCAELRVAPGTYDIGLLYRPLEGLPQPAA
jgi:hypothetical protein